MACWIVSLSATFRSVRRTILGMLAILLECLGDLGLDRFEPIGICLACGRFCIQAWWSARPGEESHVLQNIIIFGSPYVCTNSRCTTKSQNRADKISTSSNSQTSIGRGVVEITISGVTVADQATVTDTAIRSRRISSVAMLFDVVRQTRGILTAV